MGEFSFSELILIIIIAIVIYGKDLPQAARKLAIVYNKFRRQLADIKDEIHRQIPMDEIQNSLKVDLPDPMSPQAEIPMPPTSVIAQVADTAKVVVTWNSVPGATTYNLKRSTSSVDPLLTVAMGLTDLSYIDAGLETGKTYHYVVTAQNSSGESGSSEEGVVTLPAEIAATPEAAPAAPAPAENPSPVATAPSTEAAAAAGGNGAAPAPAEGPTLTADAAAQPPGNGSPPHPVPKPEEPPAA